MIMMTNISIVLLLTMYVTLPCLPFSLPFPSFQVEQSFRAIRGELESKVAEIAALERERDKMMGNLERAQVKIARMGDSKTT